MHAKLIPNFKNLCRFIYRSQIRVTYGNWAVINQFYWLSNVWGSHGGKDVGHHLTGCDAGLACGYQCFACKS